MRIKDEYIRLAAENIADYFKKEAGIGERLRANLAELAAYAAQRAARDVRTREFFSTGIYEQGITRYDASLKLVQGREIYTNAAVAMLNAEYEYARDKISWGK